jgi:hypothetical protein
MLNAAIQSADLDHQGNNAVKNLMFTVLPFQIHELFRRVRTGAVVLSGGTPESPLFLSFAPARYGHFKSRAKLYGDLAGPTAPVTADQRQRANHSPGISCSTCLE